MAKVQEDESQQKGFEAQVKNRQSVMDPAEWGFRPAMSSYCGFLEDQQRYPIFEIKNIGGRCEDFSDKAKPSHSCKTCIHLVAAGGLSDDRDRERDLAAMQLENIATKSQSSTPELLLTKHREGASSRKAFELSGAYAAKGVMGNQPQYLDWCRALSKESAYVITVMANPYDACTVWEPASGVASAQPKPKAVCPSVQDPIRRCQGESCPEHSLRRGDRRR